MIKIRASSISNLMTEPKNKGEILSVGAKTHIEDLAKQFVYGYTEQISSKYLEKGTLVEDQALALRNDVFFTDYSKNTERRDNEWITGECDIYTSHSIIDIKSSWSLATFPATTAIARKEAEKAGYDWQLRAYMWLWDVDHAEVNYCLVNTPDELIGYEDPALHFVDHIDPSLRVTRVAFERDKALEDRMRQKVEAARIYFDLITEMIADDHAAQLEFA